MKPPAEWRLEGLGHGAGGSRRAFASALSLLNAAVAGAVLAYEALAKLG